MTHFSLSVKLFMRHYTRIYDSAIAITRLLCDQSLDMYYAACLDFPLGTGRLRFSGCLGMILSFMRSTGKLFQNRVIERDCRVDSEQCNRRFVRSDIIHQQLHGAQQFLGLCLMAGHAASNVELSKSLITKRPPPRRRPQCVSNANAVTSRSRRLPLPSRSPTAHICGGSAPRDRRYRSFSACR